MLQIIKNLESKRVVISALPLILLVVLLYSCASMGRPDGGPLDETPPRFIGSSPGQSALNVSKKKIILEFDEFIKLEKPSEKVVISPPQIQQPEIKVNGKKVQIELLDTLKLNSTYTVDFSDAIVDNNENNPLGNFAFTFSTGSRIDTMQVSGTVLEASTLEPIKGILVGLHQNLADSTFTTLPFERVARTDSRGRFTIRGIAPGKYHIYALMDADQNFAYTQKSEILAFNDELVVPTIEERTRMDTAWVDSLTYDTVIEKKYTHYLPDDLILCAFKEPSYSQYLIKSERLIPQKISLYFAAPADSLPLLRGLNFEDKDAFIVEHGVHNDTLHYWIKDSLVYQQDTLSLSVSYLYTDTLGQLVPRLDTLNLVSKQKTLYKEEPKKKKKKRDEEEAIEQRFLTVNVHAPSTMNVYDEVSLDFDEPIKAYDRSAVHLCQKIDTLWKEVSFDFVQDSLNLRKYHLYYDWEPQGEYKFSVDSLGFEGLYGVFGNKIDQKFKVRSEDEYFTLHFNVTGACNQAFIELLNAQDQVVRRRRVVDGVADFYFLDPGKYGARLIDDLNGNGVWDPGSYPELRQPEKVYYYPNILEYKALWDATQQWDVKAVSLDKQKPEPLKKQKPDEDKQKKNKQNRRR